MAPKKNVLVMVINIGSTSFESNSLEEEPFIDKAKYAMKILIEKKIFLQPKDVIGIITMGDETIQPDDNNIKLYCENLLVPDWDMVKYVNNLTASRNDSNWIEAFHTALCFIKEEVIDPQDTVFLVIFNNFKEDRECIDIYDPDPIIEDLNTFSNLHILFVGENPLNDRSWQEDSASASELFALSIMKEAKAQYEEISNFIELRRFYIPPETKPLPWKFNLNCCGVNIPCSSYVKIRDCAKVEPWKMQVVSSKDSGTNAINPSLGNPADSRGRNVRDVYKENVKVDLHRNEIEPQNIINGYKFGGRYIPFSEDDEAAMQYSGSSKGITIYGFVPQNEVKLEYWAGSAAVIVPTPNTDETAFYSLVQAMAEKEHAAIIRKVYLDNKSPKMGVLFPKIDDDNIWCLVHLEIPFVNELRVIKKNPIKSYSKMLNAEKLEAIDKFIDSMTISETEHAYMNPGAFPNVRSQYQWNAIADRVLNPEHPLLVINDYLKKLLEPPDDLKIKAKPHIEALNKLFPLCKIYKRPSKKEKEIVVVNARLDVESENQPEISISRDEQIPDPKFFAPEDMDIQMEEFDEM